MSRPARGKSATRAWPRSRVCFRASGSRLLVLDTFEEVLYRSSDFVKAIGLFIDELSTTYPSARTVIGSRARITQFRTQEVALSALDEKAAIGFLRYRGVADEGLAKAIFQQLGGNPLTLRLAADLVRSESETAGLKSISTRSHLLFRVEEKVIQGQLYRRILNHIQDDEVRQLAHPGLVVRRITPAVIKNVLAEPVGLKIDSIGEARDLFRRLAKEVSLVENDGHEAVRHRADVRKVMLHLLSGDNAEAVKSIHQRAIEYYRHEKGTRARAEEIYHRLMLEQEPATIDARWRDALESYLSPSYEELPASSRAYLATKLGYEIDDATRKAADTAVWERAAVAKAQDLLALSMPQQALDVLCERTERSALSLVHELEVQALQMLGRHEEAVEVVERALPTMRTAAGALRFIALAETGAESAQLAGNPQRAIALLESAALVARTSAEPVTRLRIATQLLELRNEVSAAPRHADEDELVALYRNTPPGEVHANESVVFAAAAMISDRLPSALLNAIALAHKAHWTQRTLEALTRAVQRLRSTSALVERVLEELESLETMPTSQRGREVRRILSRLVDLQLPTGEAALSFARVIQTAAFEPIEAEPKESLRLRSARPSKKLSRRPRSSSRRRLK